MELWSGARAEAEGQGPSLQEGSVLVLGKGRAPIADHIHHLDRSGKWIYLSPEKQQTASFPSRSPLSCPFSFGVKGRGCAHLTFSAISLLFPEVRLRSPVLGAEAVITHAH